MRDSVVLNSWDSFFNNPALNLVKNLRDVLLGNSRNRCFLWLAVPGMFLCFPWNSCQLSLVSYCCHFWSKKLNGSEKRKIFLFFKEFFSATKCSFFLKEEKSLQKILVNWVTNMGIILVNTIHHHNSIFVSPIYTISLAGNKIVYTPSQGQNRKKYLNHTN